MLEVKVGEGKHRENLIPKTVNYLEHVLIIGAQLGRFDFYFPDFALFITIGEPTTVGAIKEEIKRREFFESREETYIRVYSVEALERIIRKVSIPKYFFPKNKREVKIIEPKVVKKRIKVEKVFVRGSEVKEHINSGFVDEDYDWLIKHDVKVMRNITITNQKGMGRVDLFLPERKILIIDEPTKLQKIVGCRLKLLIVSREKYKAFL